MTPRAETLFLMLMHEVRGKKMSKEIIDDHVEHLKQLDSEGKLVVCGPFLERHGVLKILKASDMEEARLIAESDPFIKYGIETYELLEFEYAHAGNGFLVE